MHNLCQQCKAKLWPTGICPRCSSPDYLKTVRQDRKREKIAKLAAKEADIAKMVADAWQDGYRKGVEDERRRKEQT